MSRKGFIGTRVWEGFYQVINKDGNKIWVIDRATITKYRNTRKDNVICVSGGVLLETTDILDKKT